MAIYIDDTGSHGYDALLETTDNTDFDYDDTNKLVWFGTNGTASTGVTLPDSAFIVYEVYAPDSYTNGLTGGTNVYSKIEYTTTIGTIADTLSSWYTAFDGATAFSTYKVKATYYKGSDKADVYFADEVATFALTGGTEEGVDDGDFTAHSTEWIITNELFSADVSSGTTLGDEELLNPDFTSNVTDWENSSLATFVWDENTVGEGSAESTTSDGGWQYFRTDDTQLGSLSSTATYRLVIDVDFNGGGGSCRVYSVGVDNIQNGGGGNATDGPGVIIEDFTTDGEHTVDYVIGQSSEQLRVYPNFTDGDTETDPVYVKSISLKEVDPA